MKVIMGEEKVEVSPKMFELFQHVRKYWYEQGKKDFVEKLDKEVDEWSGIAGGWYKGWIREFIKKELNKHDIRD